MYPHLWAGQPQGLLQASQPPGVFQPGKRQLTSLTSHLLSALSWPPAHSPPPRFPSKSDLQLNKGGLGLLLSWTTSRVCFCKENQLLDRVAYKSP